VASTLFHSMIYEIVFNNIILDDKTKQIN